MAYSTSKTALNAITVHYARSLEETPIKVNGAAPGHVATDFNAFHRHADRGTRSSRRDTSPRNWTAMGQQVWSLKTTISSRGELPLVQKFKHPWLCGTLQR